MNKKIRFTKDTEIMEELLRQAWLLSDEQIDSLKPGKINETLDLINFDYSNHPFSNMDKNHLDVDLLRVMRNPDYFYFTCKTLFNKDTSESLQIAPFQSLILKELWTKQFPMILATRGGGKSFLLAVYIMLRLIFTPGSKVVIVAAAFRQTKVVFEYMEKIWYSSPILRDLVSGRRGARGRESGPRRDIDRCEFVIGDSVAIALPLGDGKKIRGLRANYVISEEFASIAEEVYATVVQGFASVTADPINNMKDYARQRVLKVMGFWSNEMDEEEAKRVRGNQSILSGTAYYSFNHFCKYWKEYREIIETKGNKEKIKEILKTDEIPSDWNWADYSIIRIPFQLIPKGYMDGKTIARAKQTTNKSRYLMEYEACTLPDTLIVTPEGTKRIDEIKQEDLVLTHKGRFQKVTKTMSREYDGKIISLLTNHYNKPIKFTPEHPFWIGEENWENCENVLNNTNLTTLKVLSEKTKLDIRNHIGEYYETQCGKIYPKHSQARFSREEIQDIRTSKLNQTELAKKYRVRQGTINTILNNKRCPKNSLNPIINLDRDFGLILGYYAAEGSTGADGKAVCFSLDGHKNIKMESYLQELFNACERVFGFAPKIYNKQDNTVSITLNQKLLVDLFKYLCPGVSHTKFIQPDILYSNPEFMIGFIRGYWNGDGHISIKMRTKAVANCVNINLLSQIRLALSYFGVLGSLYHCKTSSKSIFRGKEYNNKPKYSLVINSDTKDFIDFLYNDKEYIKKDYHKLKIRKRTEEHYSGLVYNLHVENDESYSVLNSTVHNCFANDSEGFFPRSLIHKCCIDANNLNPPKFKSCNGVPDFNATLTGNQGFKYVYAMDPASEDDRFAITVLELWPDHRRIVYAWSTKKKEHAHKVKKGMAEEHDFFRYCARKVRDLMNVFPAECIAIDSGGGGIQMREALGDPENLREGEQPLYPIIEEGKEKPTDDMQGMHILHMIKFQDRAWISEANYGLKKDMEEQVLVFPMIDSVALGLALEVDKSHGRVIENNVGEKIYETYDTLEACMMEIEELKDELSSIVLSKTPTGGEHWDTPDRKTEAAKQKGGRMRKDRYSSLLMANMLARQMVRQIHVPEGKVTSVGGFANQFGDFKKNKKAGPLYSGPSWFTNATSDLSEVYGTVVTRN